jgi:hypothetical protein
MWTTVYSIKCKAHSEKCQDFLVHLNLSLHLPSAFVSIVQFHFGIWANCLAAFSFPAATDMKTKPAVLDGATSGLRTIGINWVMWRVLISYSTLYA